MLYSVILIYFVPVLELVILIYFSRLLKVKVFTFRLLHDFWTGAGHSGSKLPKDVIIFSPSLKLPAFPHINVLSSILDMDQIPCRYASITALPVVGLARIFSIIYDLLPCLCTFEEPNFGGFIDIWLE